MEIFVLIGLIFLNGLFAMSEIAIVTAKKSRLMILAAKGDKSAQAAIKLAESPTRFLSTIQIGITSIGIMNGIFGESVLAEPFAQWMQTLGVPVTLSDNVATVLVVIVITYLSIVIGELVPKRIGQVRAESIACAMAKPMQILAIVTKPLVFLLSGSTRTIMRLFGFNQHKNQSVTEEDIHAMLDEGSDSGVIEQQEHTMVKNVLRLEERSISSLMVHRSDIIYLDTSLSFEENYLRVTQSPHSRFPVCDRNYDNLIGVIDSKELLAHAVGNQQIDLAALSKECHLVPESLTAMELLKVFRASRSKMVFVVDEYGILKGIVTLQDLLEALTGEFTANSEEESYVVRREDGSLLLDGMLSAFELKDCLGVSELPDEGHYQTLSGLIMLVMGKLPNTGDKVIVQGWKLEVVDMDGRKIDKVLAYPLNPID